MSQLFKVTQYAAIFDKENRLLLMRDAVHEGVRGKWVFPGGHIDEKDRDSIDSLTREVKEETSLKINSAWVFKTAIKRNYSDGILRYVVYYVCQAKGNIRISKEHDAFEWTDLEKIKKMNFRDNEEKQLIVDLLIRKNAK